VILALAIAACHAPADAPAPAWGAPKVTQSGRYKVGLELIPDPPKLGELFVVHAAFTELNGTPIEDGQVKLNARMPQHNHGMETDPQNDPGICDQALANGATCKHPGGIYETTGFKFHMGGPWTITVDVVGPRGADSTSFVYDFE
jgi:hypothetical protein